MSGSTRSPTDPETDSTGNPTVGDTSLTLEPGDELASTSSTTTTTMETTSTSPSSVPAEGDCHPAYGGCIPYHPGDALDCDDIDTSNGPVEIQEIGVDPYDLDDDEDGTACEATD